MPERVHHQQHGYHLPRILGWEVAGRIAPTIVADSRCLVAIFGREPPGVPFTVYMEPGGERISYRRGAPTTFFVGAQGLWSAGLTAAMVDVSVAGCRPRLGGRHDARDGAYVGAGGGSAPGTRAAAAGHGGRLVEPRRGRYLSTNRTHADDPDATGCGVLFLGDLHDGLSQPWPVIVQTGGTTLAATSAALTGQDAAARLRPSVRPCTRGSTGPGRAAASAREPVARLACVPPGECGNMPARLPGLAGEGMVTRTRRQPRSRGHEEN